MVRNPASKHRTYFKEWRSYRGLTQSAAVARIIELAGDTDPDDPGRRVPKTEASLSRIENGKQPYTQAVLEVLADVYQTHPEYLISRDPTKEGKVLSILDHLTPDQYRQAEAVLEALARSGTHG
ncbi:helix-turn-helix domain-containing protein [Sphingomonas colocasiae]|uniref:Helix-turn-helix domain-containing protein n=1 Tax=Sphingomonas colocasiae TaxID=1848973 RepID=A0ABS7PXK6_9SPHN|nr:helix-turn-helix transcriptional regulator [Sphingomonas colocasiae]MBY8826089.1 helix-turn-helix domain-containing protein [Sphingomonas colocasiae]